MASTNYKVVNAPGAPATGWFFKRKFYAAGLAYDIPAADEAAMTARGIIGGPNAADPADSPEVADLKRQLKEAQDRVTAAAAPPTADPQVAELQQQVANLQAAHAQTATEAESAKAAALALQDQLDALTAAPPTADPAAPRGNRGGGS